MKSDGLPQVGDVIRSICFVYGERDLFNRNNRITVGRDTPEHMVGRYMTKEEIDEYVKTNSKMPESKMIEENLGSVDLSRAKAEYVVIEARYQGGGSEPNDPIPYPDGWHVVAKRLSDGRVWNPDGEEIQFYMNGCFMNMIPPRSVKIVGQMRLAFVE